MSTHALTISGVMFFAIYGAIAAITVDPVEDRVAQVEATRYTASDAAADWSTQDAMNASTAQAIAYNARLIEQQSGDIEEIRAKLDEILAELEAMR